MAAPLNFEGTASNLTSTLKAAGVVVPAAEAAAKRAAEAPPSAPEACNDPSCTADHSHEHHGHDHGGHNHGHDGHDHDGHDHDGHNHGHDSHDHGGHDHGGHDHGHAHEHLDHPGNFNERDTAAGKHSRANFDERAFTIGVGGPVGSGKTALMLKLCQALRDRTSLVAITNDIFTREDGEFLNKHKALEKARIRAVETGGCPHAAIREDISANLQAAEELTAEHKAELVLIESGGDNLAANYSSELADFTLYVIDVSGGDKVPRKGGPGITQSDLLIVNKTDLADAVGADLDVMARDAKLMRGDGPTVFAQVKHGVGVDEIVKRIIDAAQNATETAALPSPKKARHS